MRYDYNIKDGWPDKLTFISPTWKPMQDLKRNNLAKYELILSGSSNSLWKIRNKIAHEGHNVSITEYSKYVEAALWVISELKMKIPNVERLSDKKRRSDAQLKKR